VPSDLSNDPIGVRFSSSLSSFRTSCSTKSGASGLRPSVGSAPGANGTDPLASLPLNSGVSCKSVPWLAIGIVHFSAFSDARKGQIRVLLARIVHLGRTILFIFTRSLHRPWATCAESPSRGAGSEKRTANRNTRDHFSKGLWTPGVGGRIWKMKRSSGRATIVNARD
jgi:hypothetical protein